MANKYILISLLTFMCFCKVYAQTSTIGKDSKETIVTDVFSSDAFPLVYQQSAAALYFEADDYEMVKIAAKDLQEDIEKVSHIKPEICDRFQSPQKNVVIIGTIGKNKKLAELSKQNKIYIEDIGDQWETFRILLVEKPFPNIDNALVIASRSQSCSIIGKSGYTMERCPVLLLE